MSALRAVFALSMVVALDACAGAPSNATSAVRPTPVMISRAAATLVCPLVIGKLYPLEAMHGDARDAYVWVRACEADVRGDGGVTLRASAAVWMVVDRDIGPVHLEQFVQGTVSLDVAYAVFASYEHGHAEVTLRPLARPRSDVAPVGYLDPQPLNWAALAAETFVPALGTTSEWVAKDAARAQAVSAIADVLGREIHLGIDARHDRLWLGAPTTDAPMPTSSVQRLRVAARGTGLVGPFTGDMALQVNRVSEGRRVVAQALCPDALDRMLARDRRAELVDTSAWIELTSGTTSTFQAPSTCEWMLAVRAQGSESSTVTLDTRPVASRAVRERSPLIAVSVDAITVDGALAHADVDLWVRAEDERVRVARARHPSEPHLFLVHAGAKLVVEVTRRGESAVLSKASLPLADGEHTVVLADQEGNQGAARVHARLFPEPRFDDGELRP